MLAVFDLHLTNKEFFFSFKETGRNKMKKDVLESVEFHLLGIPHPLLKETKIEKKVLDMFFSQ